MSAPDYRRLTFDLTLAPEAPLGALPDARLELDEVERGGAARVRARSPALYRPRSAASPANSWEGRGSALVVPPRACASCAFNTASVIVTSAEPRWSAPWARAFRI